jgi:hypothetical protein
VVNDVWQSEIHTDEILVHEHSSFEVEIAFEKLKRCKSPGIDQILAELIQAGGITLRYGIRKFINCIWNKKELPEQWKKSVIVHTATKIKLLKLSKSQTGSDVSVQLAS